MNLIQQAHLCQKLTEVNRTIEETRRLMFEVGFLDSFHLRQADASLKLAYDGVTNALNHLSVPCNSPRPADLDRPI